MKRKYPLVLLLLVIGLATPSAIFAANFFTPDLGAKTFARGGAYIANGGDLSTTYINPACLTKHHGTNFKLEILWATLAIEYRREPYRDSITNDNPGDPIPFVAISSDFGLDDFVFAFSAYGPYSIGAYYPKDSDARYSGIDVVTIAALLQLTVAWQPLDWFSVGVGGAMISFGKHDQYAFSLLHDNDTRYDVIANFDATSFDTFNWLAGLWFKPWEHMEIGLSFFAGVDAKMYGEITAELPDLYGAILGTDTYTDEVTLTAPIADQFRFGVGFPIVPGTDVEVDVTYSTWSKQKAYTIDFKKEELMDDFLVPKNAKDTWNFRIGGDVMLLDWLTVRTGYQFDQTSTKKDFQGPGGVETDKHMVGAGMSLYAWGIEVDLGYQHVFQADITVPRPTQDMGLGDGRGTLKSSMDFFAIAFNWNFGDFYRALKGKDPIYRKGKGLL